MTVERVPVGEVLTLQRRAVEVVPDREYAQVGIRSFGRGIFHKEPVSGASLGAKRVFRIEPGDLVISNVFAWEGAVGLASEAEAGMIGSHRFMTFVPIDGRIDPSWATWYFRSEPGLMLIRKASPGSAGRNRTLAIDRFASLEIPLPPIDKQRECAAQLAAVADATERAGTRVCGDDADMFSSLLPGLVDSIVRSRAVESITVSDAANFVSDTVHPGDDAGPAASFVGLQHIESDTGRRLGSDDIGLMKGRKFRFQPGDILYGYLRPYLNKVWLADRHGLCSVDQYVLRPKIGVSGALLAYCLRGRGVPDTSDRLDPQAPASSPALGLTQGS